MTTNVYDSDIMEVGDLLRQQREKRNITQCELAEKSGLGEKSISRLELGANMKLSTFFMLADALGVTPNDISPKRLLANGQNPEFRKIEGKYLSLTDKQKAMACAMMESIIDHISEYS